ncbi:unnamed protein product [Prorocentrum cordatum]|uniref:Uncharacterized protein n=1 Tax=Prorocentrum cordatum TaxID=2364126 RepID=A0ABN9PR82_9DINO|nr:unnamed protein product [Polarella glacialis]
MEKRRSAALQEGYPGIGLRGQPQRGWDSDHHPSTRKNCGSDRLCVQAAAFVSVEEEEQEEEEEEERGGGGGGGRGGAGRCVRWAGVASARTPWPLPQRRAPFGGAPKRR